MVSLKIHSHDVSEAKLWAENWEIALALSVADGQVYALQDEFVGLKDQVVDLIIKI